MKTITTSTERGGKTCKPRYIPNNEKMTAHQLQGAYDEIANGYEQKIWFDQYILGVARQRKQLMASVTSLSVITPSRVNWPHVTWFLGLAFGLSWLVDLVCYRGNGL